MRSDRAGAGPGLESDESAKRDRQPGNRDAHHQDESPSSVTPAGRAHAPSMAAPLREGAWTPWTGRQYPWPELSGTGPRRGPRSAYELRVEDGALDRLVGPETADDVVTPGGTTVGPTPAAMTSP